MTRWARQVLCWYNLQTGLYSSWCERQEEAATAVSAPNPPQPQSCERIHLQIPPTRCQMANTQNSANINNNKLYGADFIGEIGKLLNAIGCVHKFLKFDSHIGRRTGSNLAVLLRKCSFMCMYLVITEIRWTFMSLRESALYSNSNYASFDI